VSDDPRQPFGRAPAAAGVGVILVVDADPATRLSIRDLLRGRGHSVVTAVSGREALEMVAHARPGLVVLAMDAPALDGRAFLRALLDRGARVPIVVIGDPMDHEEPPAYPRVVGRATKPIRPDELIALIEPPRAA
jgi:CheY-like chemotaxis protein